MTKAWNAKHIKFVKILGEEFEIVHRKPKKSCYGECMSDKRKIELNNNLTGDFAKRVLIHEMTHGMLHLAGYDYHLNENLEEQLCTLMESFVPHLMEIIDGKNNQQ